MFLAANNKFDTAFQDQCHLLVRVGVFGRYEKRVERKPHHHHIFGRRPFDVLMPGAGYSAFTFDQSVTSADICVSSAIIK